jgi:hypothetical protein
MLKYSILLAIVLIPIVSWADTPKAPTQTQGFESYIESASGAKFICKKQCFIVLDGMKQSQYIQLTGEISGSGGI